MYVYIVDSTSMSATLIQDQTTVGLKATIVSFCLGKFNSLGFQERNYRTFVPS